MLKVDMMPVRDVPDEKLGFAVVMARTACGWLFARHRERRTWEIPGGHREGREPVRQTAVRELYEETGAEASVLSLVCAYSVDDGGNPTYGALYFAEVGAMHPLPASEIKEVQCFDALPEALTYPDIQPILFKAGVEFALSWDYAMSDVF